MSTVQEALSAPFATPALVEQRTAGAVTAADYPYMEAELAAASADIRRYCRWHVAPVGQVSFRRVLPYPDEVWLPAMRVVSVDAVTVDGVAWSAEDVAAVPFDPETGWTPLQGRDVTVQFTAGFEKVPPDVEAAAVELAVSGLTTALGQTREQAGGVSLQYARTGGGIPEGSALARRLDAYRLGRLP